MSGIDQIAAERNRQVAVEGWTPEDDDEHDNGELALVAALYASPVTLYEKHEFGNGAVSFADPWPASWASHWDKRQSHDLKRRLVIAGALIAAEIDRIERGQARGALLDPRPAPVRP